MSGWDMVRAVDRLLDRLQRRGNRPNPSFSRGNPVVQPWLAPRAGCASRSAGDGWEIAFRALDRLLDVCDALLDRLQRRGAR